MIPPGELRALSSGISIGLLLALLIAVMVTEWLARRKLAKAAAAAEKSARCCADCAWCLVPQDGRDKDNHWRYSCGHPDVQRLSPVTGRPETVPCSTARMSYAEKCGEKGALWKLRSQP